MTANERTRLYVFYASKRRVDLIRVLSPSGACGCCKRVLEHRALEVDHVHGRNWLVQNLGQSSRVAKYWAEYKAGVEMRALCRSCSARGGSRRYPNKRT